MLNIELPEPLKTDEMDALLQNLTPENRNILAERFLRLAAKIAEKFTSNPNLDEDEAFAIASVGLVKASRKFDPSRNIKFSTYATRCIQNELNMYLRDLRRKGGPPTVSMNQELPGSGDEAITIEDILSDNWYGHENMFAEIAVEDIIRLFNESLQKTRGKTRDIILDRMRGMKQNDIAALRHCNQTYVSKACSRFKKRFRERLKKEGLIP